MKLSRRLFLKSTGIAAAAAAMGTGPVKQALAHEAKPQLFDNTWHKGHCRMCMKGDCANMWRAENGVVVEVKGNPDAPHTRGALCPRGHSILQNLYNPYRVKSPMKRTNPKKGLNEDPGWVEISWEEAFRITADKLKAIHKKDPRRLIFTVGFGDMNYFCTSLFYFTAAYGTPNFVKSNGTLCAFHFATDITQGIFPTAVADLTHSKYVVTLGRNMGLSMAAANGDSRGLVNAVKNGLKLVVVDPRCTPEATKGQWVPIKPGTDLAFVLAMAHSIIYDVKKYDVDFLQWRTNAPYLIGKDGAYYRGKDGKPQIVDKADGKMKSFDDKTLKNPDINAVTTVSGQELKASFVLLKDHLKQYTPAWAEKITTIPAKQIKQIAADFIKNAGIGETITLNGQTFPLRHASIGCHRGVTNQRDGSQADLICKIMNMLIGNLDMPGGMLGCFRGDFLKPDKDGVVAPKGEALMPEPDMVLQQGGSTFGVAPTYPPQHIDLHEYFPHRHTTPAVAFQVAANPQNYDLDYEIDGMLTVGGNPISSTSEPYVLADTISKIPFTATLAYHYDEMAQLSDILLPSNAMLEKESINFHEFSHAAFHKDNLGLSLAMGRDPVPNVFNSKQSQDIIMELCARIGILDKYYGAINDMGVMLGEVTFAPIPDDMKLDVNKRHSVRELWDIGIKSRFGRQHSFNEVLENGFLYKYEPLNECYNSHYYKKGEYRHPVYFDRLVRTKERIVELFENNPINVPGYDYKLNTQHYEPMVTWRENPVNTAGTSKSNYELVAFNFKIPFSPFRVGAVDQLPWLNEAGEKYEPYYNTVHINNATAAKLGFKTGDTVTVESENGHVTGKLVTTELVHPQAVGIGGSLGRVTNAVGPKAASFMHYNRLTNAKLDNTDPISGGVINNVPVKIYKGGK